MKMKILIIFLFFTGIIFISYVKSNKEEINYTIIGEKELFSNNIISKNFSDLIYDELSKKNNSTEPPCMGFGDESIVVNKALISKMSVKDIASK